MKLISTAEHTCVVILLVLIACAAGEANSRFAVFGGYSSQADVSFAPVSFLPISLPSVSLNGWNVSGEGKVLPFLGLVLDVSGHYGSYGATIRCETIIVCVPVGVSVNSSLYSFMAGPQVSVSLWRFTPFAHVLLGAAHVSQKPIVSFVGGLANSDTAFADAIGGGIDIRIFSIVNWRFQGDLIQTRFFASSNPISFLTSTQSNFRGSTGVVLRF
jgi:hypothetical protein